MNKTINCLLITTCLSSCSNSDVANDKNMTAAIQQYLKNDGALCLHLSKWPLVLESDELKMLERFPKGLAGQMSVLERAGVVSSQSIQLEGVDFFGKPNAAKSYQLTALGKKFYHEKSDSNTNPSVADLCFAEKSLGQLVKWQYPNAESVHQVVATYTYNAINVADWAKTEAFKSVFSDAANMAFNSLPEERTIILTDSGWQVKPYTVTSQN